MKSHKPYKEIILRFYIFVFLIVFGGHAVAEEKVAAKTTIEPESKEVPLSKRIYHLQHKIISKWAFESSGAFYDDMRKGNTEKLISAASEVVTPEYANGILVESIENKEAVLIAFPTPSSPANCFFVIVKKEAGGYAYFTYEKTLDLGEPDVVGVVGAWSKDGRHSNYGARGYKTSAEFIQDILGNK